jgi:hypothetical protein
MTVIGSALQMSDSKFYLKNAEERKKLPLWEERFLYQRWRGRETLRIICFMAVLKVEI